MRKVKRFLAALLLMVMVTGMAVVPAQAAQAPAGMKGVWISFLDFQSYLKGTDQAGFDSRFGTMCDVALSKGCNALFVHVRSHNDAIYPSAIYPWSTTMLNGNPGFNPLSDIVSIAHSKGLAVHAWINPYGYRNGAFSGNAALSTNENVVAGVQEIISNYAVDGIHFDDYFPPFGKDAINAMVQQVHSICSASGKVFGMSPQGNISNCRAMGADVDTWLSTPGYVDYLCPQLYWSNNYGAAGNVAMFSSRAAAWKALNKAGIPLYVGLAAYKSGQLVAGDPGWALKNNNLASQVDVAANAGYSGYILYRYESLIAPAAQTELANLKARG